MTQADSLSRPKTTPTTATSSLRNLRKLMRSCYEAKQDCCSPGGSHHITLQMHNNTVREVDWR